ncbi:globin-like protein [Tribonema minus]|uniref:Globin-like protein n=1 Tax=Tribonema minus TaxID=303371 RepID=A0A835YJB0_9STRA|nr:globin-like protein [Tribonema minus]
MKPAYANANPNVTPEQVKLLRASFALVSSGNTVGCKSQSEQTAPTVHLALVFYNRLFEIAPETKPRFKKPLTKQGGMLIKTLALSIATLADLPSLVPRLQSLAARHIRYGSTIAQYGAVGEALVWALQTVAGDAFTPAMAGAWVEVYSLILSFMIPAQVEAEAKRRATQAAGAPLEVSG